MRTAQTIGEGAGVACALLDPKLFSVFALPLAEVSKLPGCRQPKDQDLAEAKRLVEKDPSIVRCHYAYRTPLYFAVRENQVEVVEFLLDHGADPLSLAVNDGLLDICRDRGYLELEKLLQAELASRQGASTKGEPIAEAIRERNLEKVRRLLDASPELLDAGDKRSNQPIHWAVMTRQIEFFRKHLG